MKRRTIMCGIIVTALSLYANPNPKADVYLRITDDLPKLRGTRDGWSGIFSVTNTGVVKFAVVIDDDWSSATTRFYLEGNEEQQRNYETVHGLGKRWMEQQREQVASLYYFGIKANKATQVLQPGESISFECKYFDFDALPGVPMSLYKAEMYLGDDTWVPVHITPTPSVLVPLEYDRGKPVGDFYYAKEGTNQWLYVKTDDDKFKRVREMKLDSKPQKAKEENAVTFEALDGTRKKLTREQARQIINDAAN